MMTGHGGTEARRLFFSVFFVSPWFVEPKGYFFPAA
jgi:hypothetical protein